MMAMNIIIILCWSPAVGGDSGDDEDEKVLGTKHCPWWERLDRYNDDKDGGDNGYDSGDVDIGGGDTGDSGDDCDDIVLTWWWKSKVLGNKRDLPGALDETGLIERMGLSAVQVGLGKTITTIIIIITINQSKTQRRHHLQYQHLSHQNHHHTLDHSNYNYFQDIHHLITTGPGDLLLLDQLQGKRQHWYHITGKKQTNQTGNLPKKYSWKLSHKKNTVMEKSKIVNWKILMKYTPVVDSTQQVRRPGPIRYFIVVLNKIKEQKFKILFYIVMVTFQKLVRWCRVSTKSK